MIDCTFCERPLICDRCQAQYAPATLAEYKALSRSELSVKCSSCKSVLICRWCKTPYDGFVDGEAERPFGTDEG
jgi:hypothetical protein